MGILSKTSGETSKHAQPLLTFEKTLPTRLLAPKSKRHRPPNLESQTSNMTTFSKSKRGLANMPNLYSHSKKHSLQDCLLQNRRGTAFRISRAKLPT
ncbi:hypothetical protein ACFX1Q_007777 [Malus domestica]